MKIFRGKFALSAATAVFAAAWACASLGAGLGGNLRAAPPPSNFADVPYATFSNAEPAYQLYPGDEIDLTLPTAPENNKTLTVRPDGRISLPIVGEMMAAGRTLADIKAEAAARYATQLRRPIVEMQVKVQPILVYIGGEVGAPAAYPITGDANALQAIMQAGGFKTSANTKRVQIIRKTAGGELSLKNVDLSKAFTHGAQPDLVPLARGDTVFVPRSGIANIDLAVQQFVAALPVTLNYTINGSSNTVTSAPRVSP